MAWNRPGIQCSIFTNPNDVDANTGHFEGYLMNNGIGRSQNRISINTSRISVLDKRQNVIAYSLSLVVLYKNT